MPDPLTVLLDAIWIEARWRIFLEHGYRHVAGPMDRPSGRNVFWVMTMKKVRSVTNRGKNGRSWLLPAELQTAIIESPPKIDQQRDARLLLANRRIGQLRGGIEESCAQGHAPDVIRVLQATVKADDLMVKEGK